MKKNNKEISALNVKYKQGAIQKHWVLLFFSKGFD